MMNTTLSTPSAQITMCGRTEAQWTKKLHASLVKSGFQVSKISGPELPHVLGNGALLPDALILLDHKQNTTLENILETKAKDEQLLPLFVMITRKYRDPQFPGQIVLPPNPDFIVPHVEMMLKHRQERVRLQQQNNGLREMIMAQERISGEVELLKNAIVRNVSHELRTPLLQIKAAVSLLAEDVENVELINLAKGATARLETLVKNVTMLGSSLDQNFGPVIVRDTLEYARRNLGRIWLQKDAIKRININADQDLPPVLADKIGLGTVIQLLVDNALKFSADEVIVSAQRHDDKVLFSVTDQGIGIAEGQIESIFETFYQIDSSSTRKYGGTGVGLALVKLIIDNHDTDIFVDSTVGKGSRFFFRLPIADLD